MIDVPISDMFQYNLPFDPNTRIEVAVPDPISPTLFSTFYITIGDLIGGGGGAGGPVYIQADLTTIPKYDSGYQYVPMGKIRADLYDTMFAEF